MSESRSLPDHTSGGHRIDVSEHWIIDVCECGRRFLDGGNSCADGHDRDSARAVEVVPATRAGAVDADAGSPSMTDEVVLLRQALEQAAVDLRGLGVDMTGEMREYVFDTACPRIREALADSVDRVGVPGWSLLNVEPRALDDKEADRGA